MGLNIYLGWFSFFENAQNPFCFANIPFYRSHQILTKETFRISAEEILTKKTEGFQGGCNALRCKGGGVPCVVSFSVYVGCFSHLLEESCSPNPRLTP